MEDTVSKLYDELVQETESYLPYEELAIIGQYFRFSYDAHQGVTRRSGEPYICHPLCVTQYLATHRLDAITLGAALLHDVVEDCDNVDIEDIVRDFGDEVARLVDGVTKLTESDILRLVDAKQLEVKKPCSDLEAVAKDETMLKIADGVSMDPRVALIKLSDRLHNMQTLDALPVEKGSTIAQETIDFYVPLAERLGIWTIKRDLEDLALRQLDRSDYDEVSRMLESRRLVRSEYSADVRVLLKNELHRASVDAEIKVQDRHIHSIVGRRKRYRAENSGWSLDEVSDLFRVTVLTDDKQSCYLALAAIHAMSEERPILFEDFICKAKDNHFQSLITNVFISGRLVQVQIRTQEMDRIAEYGLAAHWRFQEGAPVPLPIKDKMHWRNQIFHWYQASIASQ